MCLDFQKSLFKWRNFYYLYYLSAFPLVAYPNPAKDFIIVKAKDNESKIKSVTFYSILGVQVLEYSVNMNAAEIRLDKLRPGKYLMRYLLDDNTQRVTQIIKQ